MPSSASTSCRSRAAGSITTVAPIRSASARRYGFGSLTTTNRAPACRTTAAAMQPIGPAPVIRTSSPSTSVDSAVCTALPNGSKIAATSGSTSSACFQTFVTGSTIVSANAPGRCTPTPRLFAHRWRRPARQCRHRPQTTWPSPLTRSPGWKSVTFEPTAAIRPTNSWPTTSGVVTAERAHAFHSQIWTSVPQMPARSTWIATSLMPTSGSGTSSSRRPTSSACLTSARISPAGSPRGSARRAPRAGRRPSPRSAGS